MSKSPYVVIDDYMGFIAELDFPELYPQAVMYAVFDSDPRISFGQNYEDTMRTQTTQNLDTSRSTMLHISWDKPFAETSGIHIFLVVPKETGGIQFEPSTGKMQFDSTHLKIALDGKRNGALGKRWLVTRSIFHENGLIAWCMPFELIHGADVKLILTKENAINLESID
jgi:hypothetical protein